MTKVLWRRHVFQPLALDLGTSKVALQYCGSGQRTSAPFVVAFRPCASGPGRVDGQFGEVARRMIGRAPESIAVVRPMIGGVIADVSAARAFLDHFVRTHAPTLRWKKPTVACAVPWEAGAFDLRTLGDCLSGAGVSRRRTVPGHMAALWGWDPDFGRRCGLLLLDIGAGTTDIAVVSLGRTIAARSLRCAGDAMTAAIVAHFQRNHGFQIGEASAEAAKVRYGTACPESGGADGTVVLQGKCRLRGVPVLREFPRAELALALSAPLERILAGVASTLAEVPPDVAASVFDGPAALSGGGALLDGLDRVFAARLGVGMRLADEPQFCVLRGLERMAAGEFHSTPFARGGDPDFPPGDSARSPFLRRRAAA